MITAGTRAVSFERATLAGSGLEVANAIRSYLERADGDARLALALSVSDGMVAARRSTPPQPVRFIPAVGPEGPRNLPTN